MKNFTTLFAFICTVSISISMAQDISLRSILMAKQTIATNHLFATTIQPYLKLSSHNSRNESITPVAHILPYDMTVEDIVSTYGWRGLNAESMSSMLRANYASGRLSNLTVRKGSQNICMVLVPEDDHVVGIIVDMFYSYKIQKWCLFAYEYDTIESIPAGSKVFTY